MKKTFQLPAYELVLYKDITALIRERQKGGVVHEKGLVEYVLCEKGNGNEVYDRFEVRGADFHSLLDACIKVEERQKIPIFRKDFTRLLTKESSVTCDGPIHKGLDVEVLAQFEHLYKRRSIYHNK